METINARDLILQAGDARVLQFPLPANIVVSSVMGIKMVYPTNIFMVDAEGDGTPSEIIVTTQNTVPNAAEPNWSTSPSMPLGGFGGHRIVRFADMPEDYVLLSVSVTDGVNVYVDQAAFYKIRSGTRAPVRLFAEGTSWTDSAANATVQAQVGESNRVFNDQVTIRDTFGSTGFALTKYWNGVQWVTLTSIVDTGQLVIEAVNDCYTDSHATNLTLTRGSLVVPANASGLRVSASPGWSFDNGAGTGIDGTGTLASYVPNYCFIDITVNAVTTRYYGTEVMLPNPAAGTYSVTATRVKVGTGAVVSHFRMSTTIIKR